MTKLRLGYAGRGSLAFHLLSWALVAKLELGEMRSQAGAWEREKLELGSERSWSLGAREGERERGSKR
jgi:hypothetical protein